MPKYRYSVKAGEHEAKAVGVALPISYKHSYEITKAIRGLSLVKAKRFLADVIALRRAVPFTKFNRDVGHKPGMAAGRYPVKACSFILELLESAEANAQFKGLSASDLVVKHISANKGPKSLRLGRRRRSAKRAHVEIVLSEAKVSKSAGRNEAKK